MQTLYELTESRVAKDELNEAMTLLQRAYWVRDVAKETEYNNPLTRPAAHTLQELFEELKFGRPTAGQEYLDKCIAELNEQE